MKGKENNVFPYAWFRRYPGFLRLRTVRKKNRTLLLLQLSAHRELSLPLIAPDALSLFNPLTDIVK